MKTALFATSFVALSFVLAACSGDDDGTAAPAAAEAAPVVATPAPVPSSSATPAPVPVKDPTQATTPPEDMAPDPVAVQDPPAVWAPTDLQPMALWLRSDMDVVTAPDGGVMSWHDESGLSNDATFAVNAPKLQQKGSYAAVTFDGTQALTIADDPSLQWKTDFTIIVVARSTQEYKTYGALFGKSAVAAPYAGPAFFTSYPNGGLPFAGAVGGQIDANEYSTSSLISLNDDVIRVYMLSRNGDSLAVRVNDDPASEAAVSNAADTRAIGVDAFIGGHPQSVGKGPMTVKQGFEGAIYEVIALPHAISDSEYASFFAYAEKRYIK